MPDAMYRGRLAPSPTGLLHVGHAKTFWAAAERAKANNGKLILRNEDLDVGRAKPEYAAAQLEDLAWLGITWEEGPDKGGEYGPYNQSDRIQIYEDAFETLRSEGLIFPCSCTRKDIASALSAPHQGQEEPIYPGSCRNKTLDQCSSSGKDWRSISWRFRVTEGREVSFVDQHKGPQSYMTGSDFGDFIIWRGVDRMPAYQLSCVVDDHLMGITEVVRGDDLLMSTARQILLYEALGYSPPSFFHTDLVFDDNGVRLAKRTDVLSLRSMREKGMSPEAIRQGWVTL